MCVSGWYLCGVVLADWFCTDSNTIRWQDDSWTRNLLGVSSTQASDHMAKCWLTLFIIIEHLLKGICLTVHQSSCRFTLTDMIINRHTGIMLLELEPRMKKVEPHFYRDSDGVDSGGGGGHASGNVGGPYT